MRLYHTSNVEIPHPDIKFSRNHLDFGKGFYLTTLKQQAINYGQRFLRKGDNAIMNVYELDNNLEGFSQYKHPNHQLCISNQSLLDKHLHFIESIKL